MYKGIVKKLDKLVYLSVNFVVIQDIAETCVLLFLF